MFDPLNASMYDIPKLKEFEISFEYFLRFQLIYLIRTLTI